MIVEIDYLEQNNYQGVDAFTIGTSFIACLFVGAVIGYYIDKTFGTDPLWFVIMLFVGLGAGFRNFYKFVKKMDELDKK